jgi:hypothetical protein
MAIIDTMKDKLGSKFPTVGGEPIPNAWLIVLGEPLEPSTVTAAE